MGYYESLKVFSVEKSANFYRESVIYPSFDVIYSVSIYCGARTFWARINISSGLKAARIQSSLRYVFDGNASGSENDNIIFK